MTDQELSALLREWEPTPAPLTLDKRVFAPRRPLPWWNRIPATPVAAAGALLGVLIVGTLLTLAPRDEEPPAAAAQPEQAAPEPPPAAPIVVPAPSPPVKSRPKVKQAAPPVPLPAPSFVPSTPPQIRQSTPPVLPSDLPVAISTSIVRVRIRIDKEGRVIGAGVIDGEPALRELATQAVRQWLYNPYLLNGEPVEVVTDVDVSFRPQPRTAKGRGR